MKKAFQDTLDMKTSREQDETRGTWHRPTLSQLNVDETASSTGSVSDGGLGLS